MSNKTSKSKILNPKKFKKDNDLFEFASKLSEQIELLRNVFSNFPKNKTLLITSLKFVTDDLKVREKIFKQLKKTEELKSIRNEIEKADWSKLLTVPILFKIITTILGYQKNKTEFILKVLKLNPKEKLYLVGSFPDAVYEKSDFIAKKLQYEEASKTRKLKCKGKRAAEKFLEETKDMPNLSNIKKGGIKHKLSNEFEVSVSTINKWLRKIKSD